MKRVHPGWAAHSGVVAAGLARGGFTGPATILEGRFGFYRTFLSSEFDRVPFDTLGKEWETLRVGFKPYPCCHYNHAYLDCALALRREHEFEPDAIAAIECRVPAGEVPIVCEPRESKLRPRTTYDAQFSLAYSVAAALIDGRVGLDTYTKDPGSRAGFGFASATAGWSRRGSPTGAGARSGPWSPRPSSPSSVTTPGARSRATAWRRSNGRPSRSTHWRMSRHC